MELEKLLADLMAEYGDEHFTKALAQAKKARRPAPARGGRPQKHAPFDLIMCWYRVEVVRRKYNKNTSEACRFLANNPKLPVANTRGAGDWMQNPENHNIDLDARAETIRSLHRRGRRILDSLPETLVRSLEQFIEQEAKSLPHFLVEN